MSASNCLCCPKTVAPKDYDEDMIFGTTPEESIWLDEKHSQLTQPDVIKYLDTDMKNEPEHVSQLATNYGCCSAFRVLSDEGIRMMDLSVNQIEKHAVCSARIPKVLRGGTFRSKFLNGMGHSEALLRQVSQMAGCEMVYHPMKIHQLHINFKPDDDVNEVAGSKKNIDRWHCDSTPFVLVLFATDPDEYTGGELQYFNGTREEGMTLLKSGVGLPADRVLNVGRQEKGFGVFMQGWKVFHQVTAVLSGKARTTLVYSFQPRNVLALEACSHLSHTYNKVDPLHILMPDWARYRAWKAVRRFEICAENFPSELSLQDTSASNPLAVAVNDSRTKMAQIVDSLPYSDDRQFLTERLGDGIQALREYLMDANVSESFSDSPFGLENLRDAVIDTDNAIKDILTLYDSEMVYF